MGPASNVTCTTWHSAAITCPNCTSHTFDCDACVADHGCGWCTKASGDRCIEGDAQHSYRADQCEGSGGVWNATCTDLRCPATSMGVCNGAYRIDSPATLFLNVLVCVLW